MLNLNDISFPTNKTNDEKKNNSFSNVGLKSLLQNSELLEILMKPITEEKLEISAMPEIVNYEQDLSSLNFNDLLKPTDSIQCDHDYYNKDKINEVICSDPSKEYGNPFLGQNLWNENEIYQGDTFENLELEEFLNEKNLSDTDIYFLDSLQNSDIINDNSEQTASPTNKDIIEEESMKSFPVDPINISPEIPKKKFFDESLKLHPTLKKSKKQFVPNELKDDKYWSRRKKNNVAAKRSRDTRRLKENRIVIAASYLEKENEMLRNQLEEHKNEMLKLKTRLSHYESLKL